MRNTLDDAKFKDLIKRMTKRRYRMQSKRRLIGSMPTPTRNEKNMRQRRRRLKISGDPLSLLRMEEHKEEGECLEWEVCREWVECREVEWEECPTWETLEEHHHQTAEIPRDQRSMKWTKRVNEWNIVFCKDMRLCCAHFLKILHYVTSPFDFHYHVHHDYMLL